MPNIKERFQHAWNAFRGRDHPYEYDDLGMSSSTHPDRAMLTRGIDKTIVNAIYNRIAVDAASVQMMHVRVDQNGRYTTEISSGLQERLTVEANIDQTSRDYMIDLVTMMLDKGVAASVPTITDIDPAKTSSYEILSMRVGRITQWYPRHVRIELYNDTKGYKEEVTLPKDQVAICVNPFYSVMNEPNSTLQRLLRKLVLLDSVDEKANSGKLNMIIELPYVIKTDARRRQAEDRRKELEDQLANSKYGVAYTDGTEKITQINRPLENNLLDQVQYLTDQLYSQLGLTPEIMNGTANEQIMLNYMNRIIEPILSVIADEYKRKFLTKTARTQGQSIVYIRDPFKLVPISNIADIADKFTRNEILSPNEVRGIVGFKPNGDARSDELRNRNIAQSPEMGMGPLAGDENQNEGGEEPPYYEEDEQPPDDYYYDEDEQY